MPGGEVLLKAPKIRTLTIFLVQDGLETNEYLKHGLRRRAVADVGDLYFQQSVDRSPDWLDFFQGSLQGTLPLHNASSGALLTVKRGKRVFALAFGHGRHLLEPGRCEESFGLRVTLNSVDPAKLRSVDRRTFDALSSHTRTQASQEGDVTAFGINVEQDLLRAAVGSPKDSSLGQRMGGIDSLAVTIAIHLRDVPKMLDRYLEQFEDDGYKSSFPWIDHIGEVRDKKLKDELDKELIASLGTGQSGDAPAWLAVPEIVDWSKIAGFRYRDHAKGPLQPDLHLRDFLSGVSDPTKLTGEALRRRHVVALATEQEDKAFARWSIYSCLYGEVRRNSTTYLLANGKWYRVERDFVAAVDSDVKKLVGVFNLPAYADASEGAYNERVAKESKGGIAMLDRKLVSIGGTTVEFCDLYTRNQQIIHVKRYGGSSVLSHLFAQGSVSGNAFLSDPVFRRSVNEVLPKVFRLANPKDAIDPKQFEIVYAIVSRSDKPIDEALPFFSRLNLRNAARLLKAFGYRVTLTKVKTS